ncbi:MAG: hypothetical protein MJZ57_04950 [Bacteroidales bacterium]|nr:hypothetical protein [Bacteroidales bacterium]
MFPFIVLLLLSSWPLNAQMATKRTTKNDIKVTLLSLGSGSSRFTYERAFSPKHSTELTVGVIGWGWDFINHTDSKGMLYKAAFKWNLIPQKNANSWLAGFYVKPEVVWALFDYQPKALPDGSSAASPGHTNQVALLAECGYELVLKWFVFDAYTGMGPSFGTGNANNYFHSFMLYPHHWPLAFTAGFRIGVAF